MIFQRKVYDKLLQWKELSAGASAKHLPKMNTMII